MVEIITATALAATALSGVPRAVVNSLVRPTLDVSFSGLKTLSREILDVFIDRFSEYVHNQVNHHACLNTIVFGNQKSLEDLYIPLTVVSTLHGELPSQQITLTTFSKDFIPTHSRVLITDTAGMGKSTLLKYQFLQCVKSCYAIPIFIELRHLSQTQSILDIIERQLNPSTAADTDTYFTRARIERLFKKGGLVFFFDAYDEIVFKDREVVTKDIKGFIERFPKNCFTLTSRPETGLLAFPNFKTFSIRPLEKEESFALIRKYDQGGGRAEQLIEKLSGRDYRAVQEFMRNPLLTTLLYRSFEYKQNLPPKKHVFYRQVFDALFDWHDSTKDGYNTREKKSKLDIDSFHRILRVIGFVSVIQGQFEADMDSVLGWIRHAKTACVGTSFAESDFLDDLIRAVPIFVKDGSYYRWSHKSLAEYFAAQYICTEGKLQQGEILTKILESGKIRRFSNMLDQIYDLDIAAFRRWLMLPVARSFTKFWNSSYKDIDPTIPAELIALRKCSTFGSVFLVAHRDTVLKSYEETIKTLQPYANEIWGRPIPIEDVPIAFFILASEIKRTSPILIAIPGPYPTILEILDAKRDPLVQNKAALDLAKIKGQYKLRPSKRPTEITDDKTSPLNSRTNFGPLTKQLTRFTSAVIDAPKMLGFESAAEDDSKLVSLTDELLGSLKDDT